STKDIFKVGGGKIDQWVVEKLLGYVKENVVFIKFYDPEHEYYLLEHIRRLKKRFPNIIQIIYSL
ncbi:MAG: hypothetical protein ACW98A_09975, partial [Candidatus Hodarchaeales archaeon]